MSIKSIAVEVTSSIFILLGASSYTRRILGKRFDEVLCMCTHFMFSDSMHIIPLRNV